MMPSNAGENDWISLKFMERYMRDLDAGCAGALDAYIALFPGHETTIAREYAAIQSTAMQGTDGALLTGSLSLPVSIGPYAILAELGRGGQAVVYLASDPKFSRRVALKVLRLIPGIDTSSALKRLEREAVAASRIDHPGVCAIYDAGLDQGMAYVAMQHISGRTLAALLKERGQQEPGGKSEAWDLSAQLQFFEQVARALHAAHSVGVVHRDVKPGNLMIDESGQAVVLDFGLAYELKHESGALTRTGAILGTPAYSAPEQVSGSDAEADPRIDVWGLGVTMYETLLEERPFEALSEAETYRKILNTDPTDPKVLRPDLPRDVRAILLTCLEKQPERRYGTAMALAEDLLRARRGEPVLARPAGILRRTWMRAKRHPLAAGSLLAAVLSLVLGLGFTLWSLQGARQAAALAEDLAKSKEARAASLERITRGMIEEFFLLSLPLQVPVEKLRPLATQIEAALALAEEVGMTAPDALAFRSSLLRQTSDWRLLILDHSAVDQIEKGLDRILEAEAVVESGLKEHPTSFPLLRESIALAIDKAHRLRSLNRMESSLDVMERIAPRIEAAKEVDQGVVMQRLVACALEAKAEAHARLGQLEQARVELSECLSLRRDVLQAAESTPIDRSDLALIALKLAMINRQSGDLGTSRTLLYEGILALETHALANPDDPVVCDRLADAWRQRAYLASTERNLPEARLSWQMSATYQSAAVARTPESETLRADAVKALSMVENCARASGDAEHAHYAAALRSEISIGVGEASAELSLEAASALSGAIPSRYVMLVRAYDFLRRRDAIADGKDGMLKAELAKMSAEFGLVEDQKTYAQAALRLLGSDVTADQRKKLEGLAQNPIGSPSSN